MTGRPFIPQADTKFGDADDWVGPIAVALTIAQLIGCLVLAMAIR